jgi:hypothetical protein
MLALNVRRRTRRCRFSQTPTVGAVGPPCHPSLWSLPYPAAPAQGRRRSVKTAPITASSSAPRAPRRGLSSAPDFFENGPRSSPGRASRVLPAWATPQVAPLARNRTARRDFWCAATLASSSSLVSALKLAPLSEVASERVYVRVTSIFYRPSIPTGGCRLTFKFHTSHPHQNFV